MIALHRLSFVAMFLLYMAPLTYGYIALLGLAQEAYYGPKCERACAAASRRYEGLSRGRGQSVKACKCSGDYRAPGVKPRFYVDLPVVDDIIGLLVAFVEVAGLFGFVYAPIGSWRFVASRRSKAKAEQP